MAKRTQKRKPSLEQVYITSVLKCKNKQNGCKLRANQYTCYKRMRYQKNKTTADVITLTNQRNKSKKIKPAVIRAEHEWYDCSHFK